MDYKVIKSNRRTLCITIKPDGEVMVKAPYIASKSDIEKFVSDKTPWILKHLKQIDNGVKEPKFTAEEIRKKKENLYGVIVGKVFYYSKILNVTYCKVSVRAQKTLFGSCTKSGNLSFNCVLSDMPESVIDYVVVHELCHRVYMNHSKKFWSLVERVKPDYKKDRKCLKDKGSKLISRL